MPGPFSRGLSRIGSGGGGLEPISLIRRPLAETDPPPDLQPYWPEAQQIEQARTEYEADNAQPWWARVLSAPSNLLGREALTRGLAEGGKGGLLSGIGGALEGEWDAITHAFGLIPGMKVTNFADIRKAWGSQQVNEGVANFAINLMGDVLLDPVMYLSPLGFLSKANNAATVAAAGLTIEKQVQAGIRASLAFRVPILMEKGVDVLDAMSKIPLPYFDTFKSMNVQFAKGMDQLFGIMRTNPISGPLLQRLGAVPVRDPEIAAKLKQANILSREKADVFVQGLLEKYESLPDYLKKWVNESKDHGHAIIDIIETGLTKLDNEGVILDYMKRLPDVMRTQGFRSAFLEKVQRINAKTGALEWVANKKYDATLHNLWTTAATGQGKEAVNAIETLYNKYDYFLPSKWLAEAGLTPRLGIDVEAADTMAGGLAKALMGEVGPTATEAERWTQTALSRGAKEIGQESFRAAQAEKRVTRFKDLWRQVEDGSIQKSDLESLMQIHKDAMEGVAAADKASGVLNSTLEPYFGRVMNPAVKRFIDRQQVSMMSKLKGIGVGFNKQRLLSDMTTTEADAFLMEVGSKVTGFEGLNVPIEQFKRELSEHGHWAVLNVLFPKQFINKLNRVDEELGSFFLANPILADVWRIKKSGELMRRSEFWKNVTMTDSALVLDEARLADPVASMSLINHAKQKGWSLQVIHEGQGHPELADAGQIITDQVGKDLRARISIHEKLINKEIREALDDTSTIFDERIGMYRKTLALNSKSDLTYAQGAPYSEMALKRALTSKLDGVAKGKGLRDRLKALLDGESLSPAERTRLQAIDSDIERLSATATSSKEALELLSEGPVDLNKLESFVTESSQHTDTLMAAKKGLADARAARKGVISPAQAEIDSIEDQLVSVAAQIQHSRAQEFSIRASLKHSINNMETAAREVLSQRATGIAEKGVALKEAMERLAQKGISAEMVSNEQKMWWKFKDTGKLGWDEIGPDAQQRMLKNGGKARLVAMHPDTVDAATKFQEFLHSPDPLRASPIVQTFDAAKNWFLGMTVMHPAFIQTRIRDYIGGAATAGMAGYWNATAQAIGHKVSWLIGQGAKEGRSPAEALAGQTITRAIDGAVLDHGAFLSLAQKNGLVGENLIKDSIVGAVSQSGAFTGKRGASIMDWTLGALGFKGPNTNPVLRVGRNMARYGDDSIRYGTAVSAWTKGMSEQDAIRTALHWTYGAGKDITAFERNYARRAIPLFGFMQWATKRTAELWLNKPGTLSWLGHLRDNATAALGMDQASIQRAMPKFINDGIGIPVSQTAEGPKMYLFGNIIPLGNALDLVNAVHGIITGQAGETLRYIGQNMHPALKTLGELVVNRDFYSGREISQYPGQTLEFMGVEMDRVMRHVMKSWFRGLSELDRLNIFNAQEIKVAMNAVRRDDVIGQRKELPFLERWFQSAFGPGPAKGYQIDVEEELRHARYADREELGKDKALLRRAVAEGKTADIAALQPVIADELAKIQARQKVAADYAVNEEASRKVRLIRRR